MTEQLPLSQQAMPKAPDAFDQLWKIWPQIGRTRTEGQRATSTRKKLTPKERCKKLFDAALTKTPETLIINAAKSYAESQGEYAMGLHRWLEESRWENEDGAVTGNAEKLEVRRDPNKRWTMAEGQALGLLRAMSEQGCPDDVLDGLYCDGIGVTHVNRNRGIPPTPVIKSTLGMNLWHRAASGYSQRAGYNEVAYSPEYVAYARARLEAAQ